MNKHFLILAAASVFSLILITDAYSQCGREKGDRLGYGLRNLNLTETQQEQINDLRIQHREEMIKLKSELELKELELTKLKKDENFSRTKYLNAVNDISAVKSKIAAARAGHRMDVYDQLNETQKKEFLDRCDRVMRKSKRDFRHKRMYMRYDD